MILNYQDFINENKITLKQAEDELQKAEKEYKYYAGHNGDKASSSMENKWNSEQALIKLQKWRKIEFNLRHNIKE